MTIKVRAAALLFAGLLLVSCGKKEPAKEVTSPAAGRGNAGSLVTEGQALLENGDAEGAAELFRDAMRKDPKNVEARIGAAEGLRCGIGKPGYGCKDRARKPGSL